MNNLMLNCFFKLASSFDFCTLTNLRNSGCGSKSTSKRSFGFSATLQIHVLSENSAIFWLLAKIANPQIGRTFCDFRIFGKKLQIPGWSEDSMVECFGAKMANAWFNQRLGQTARRCVGWTLLSTKIGKVTLMRPIHGNL